MREQIQKKLKENEVIQYITIFAFDKSKFNGTLDDVDTIANIKACYVYTNKRVFIISTYLKS